MPWISEKDFYFYDSQNNKPPLLDLHGFGVSANTHYKEAAYPLEKYYRLIIPEFPAHGKLKHIKNLNLKNLLEYIQNFIEFLELKDFKLVGRSVGGVLALYTSDKYNIKNPVIIETPVVEYESAFNPLFKFIAKSICNCPNIFMLNCDHVCVLEEVRSIPVGKELLSKSQAKFIYSNHDLYLTTKNRELIKGLDKPLYIHDSFGHFKDQTKESAVELVRKLLEE